MELAFAFAGINVSVILTVSGAVLCMLFGDLKCKAIPSFPACLLCTECLVPTHSHPGSDLPRVKGDILDPWSKYLCFCQNPFRRPCDILAVPGNS